MKSFATLIISFILTSQLEAAPHPATASSSLLNTQSGAFFNAKGFAISSAETGWIASGDIAQAPANTWKWSPPNQESTAALTIHLEQTSNTLKLEDYAKKFMRDYSSYGFDVLGSRPVMVNQLSAVMVDLIQKNKDQQLRQIIFKKDTRVVVLTCNDLRTNFSATLASCNKIMQSFHWFSNEANKTSVH